MVMHNNSKQYDFNMHANKQLINGEYVYLNIKPIHDVFDGNLFSLKKCIHQACTTNF